jgi:hypothetical protein
MKKLIAIFFSAGILCANAQTCTFFADQDGDAFGDPANTIEADCIAILVGYVGNDLDCDDSNANINPDGVEICNGIDDNCNGGEIDEFVTNTYYQDADGDGYGDPNFVLYECNLPFGFSENMDDCDDNMVTYVDGDGDGFGSAVMEPCGVANNLDCNDNTAAIQDSTIYYADIDEDGYGNPEDYIVACNLPTGYVPEGTDCNDLDLDIHPGAIDAVGNGIDENCDGQDGVGVLEVNTAQIQIYPNPSSDFLMISNVTHPKNWAAYNAFGQCIAQGMWRQPTTRLDISWWSPGIYLLIADQQTEILVVE